MHFETDIVIVIFFHFTHYRLVILILMKGEFAMLVIMSEATYSSLNDDVVLTQACVLPLINMYKEVNSKDGDLRLFFIGN